MADDDFKDPYIQKIYENCKKGISESQEKSERRENWQRAADFMMAQSVKHPEKSAALLECIDKLEVEFK